MSAGQTLPTALVCPGQGSQTDDMRETVERERPDLLDAVLREVGEDPFARVAAGTHYAQPAIYCASVAALERLGPLEPDFYAGHSLGEFAALVAAGSLDWADGLRLVTLRGRLTHESGTLGGGGGMVAVLSGGREAAGPIAERHGLTVANDNAPEQVVLSGGHAELDAALAEATAQGLRAMKLPVGGAFHSPHMAAAVPEFERALGAVDFARPAAPVYSGTTAEPFDDVRKRLAEGLTRPVRWREVVLALHARGVRRFVEAGPGRVLTGLVRRTARDVEALPLAKLEAARV